jgi:putative peptide zinc metalloprotease protein
VEEAVASGPLTPARRSRFIAARSTEEGRRELLARHGAAEEHPALARNLVIRRQVRMGEVTWVVKNSDTNAYYNFTDGEWGVIELFDGTRTREEIMDEYNERFPGADVDLSFVLEYEEMLRNIELLERTVAERNLTLLMKFKGSRQRAADEHAEGFNPFFIMFHVLDPNRFLERTVKYVRWIWSPPVVALWAAAAAWTVSIFIMHWAPIWTGTYELYAFLRKPLIDVIQFFFLLSIIGCVHEFGHGFATKIYGGEVHDIGIALLYFTPAFYCDTTDSLLFESKWQKLWVTTAGIYIEGFICSGATALWVASYPDTLLHDIAYKTMLFTGISTVFFNINPLIKIDGYYALSSYLEMPELREESFRYMGAVIQRRLLQLPVEVPPTTRRKRRIYWTYGILAFAYQGVLIRFIGGLFFNFYAKYFPDAAIVLLMLTLYRIYRKRVRLVTRTARLFYLDKKEWLMSSRTRRWAWVAGGVLLLALCIPWARRRISAETTLLPYRQVELQAPEESIVSRVFAHEGEHVEAGQPVLELASTRTEASIEALRAEQERYAREAQGAINAAEALRARQASEKSRSAAAALASATAQSRHLLLRSPIAGIVLTPRMQDLVGRFVPAGTSLAEVGDCRKMVAELAISERRVTDISIGSFVSAFVPEAGLSPRRGQIDRVAPAASAASEGKPAPAPPPARPETFIVEAVFDNSDGALRPGAQLRAKIYTRRAAYLGRVFRLTRRWIQSIVW